MKYFLYMMFLAAAAFVTPALAPGRSDKTEAEALREKVAELEKFVPPKWAVGVYTDGGGGSGTVVACDNGRSLILTNNHVVARDRKVDVVCRGKKYRSKFLAKCDYADLSVVTVEAALTPAEIASREPGIGEAVSHWGRASGPGSGRITETLNFQGGTGASIVTDMVSVQGDSGCGIFDSKGRLVAVHWGGITRTEEPCGVRLHVVKQFLSEAAAGQFPSLAKSLK